ncbi:NADH dehydrogenase subunit 6 (mitochondrion) [Eublepharis macularius]|uniref:NADH-ubiquinone oxidoreductase chain 6 n=1 Tax=Eublepharis macularius TaxID=481883 RepID=A0A1L7NTY8_EUBMA|nr:NADH dehydrogenase subunit 6 [Eublepharis macularius]WEF49961.1 NADH dehydrogenase subunit 6 [Eublepharis macularius]BAW33384.1 NADH dehydrogenase subunit 6 [Eublepharis macularius]
MSYFLFLFLLCFALAIIGVASNPSPFYGVIGLVMAAFFGCAVLVGFGSSFVSLVLFLIYLGGMLVVFVYSIAMSAEAYPKTWGDFLVILYVFGFAFLILVFSFIFEVSDIMGSLTVDNVGLYVIRMDFGGVMLLYSIGGPVLLLCGFGLLLVLFVVLELTRGLARGALRIV